MKQVFLIYFFFANYNIYCLVVSVCKQLIHTLCLKGNTDAQSLLALGQITVIISAAIAHTVFILIKGYYRTDYNVYIRRVNEPGFFYNRLGYTHGAYLP